MWMLFSGKLVVKFTRTMSFRPDWTVIRELFAFGLPAGVQGIAMNVAGVLLVRFIGSLPQSAEAQAAYAVGYTELFSMITWTSVGLHGRGVGRQQGQNLVCGKPDRAAQIGGRRGSKIGVGIAAIVGTGIHADSLDRCLSVFALNSGAAGQISAVSLLALSGGVRTAS